MNFSLRYFGLFAALLFAPMALLAQTALDEIGANNTTLKALRAQMQAEIDEANATTALDNPEVEFGYLWPGRKDVGVSQSFDMGTLTGRRRTAARRQADVARMDYRRSRRDILLQAWQAMIQLSAADSLLSLHRKRLADTEHLSETWHQQLAAGRAAITDVNAIDLQLALIEGEVAQAVIEADAWRAEVERLNGGKPLTAQPMTDGGELPLSFNEWFAAVSPATAELAVASAELAAATADLSLAKADKLPSLSVGYVGELVKGDNYQGVKVGLNIPLWAGGKKVQAARAAEEAARATQQDVAMQQRATLHNEYNRAVALRSMALKLKERVERQTASQLLRKALEGGEMTIADYLAQTALQQEALVRVIEAWRDYQLQAASLNAAGM